MLRGVAVPLLLAGLLSLPTICHAQYGASGPSSGTEQYRLRVEALYGQPNLTGTIQRGFGDEEGDLVDVVNDLGVGSDSQWTFRGALRLSNSVKLRGSYTPLEFTGSKNIERNIGFGDEYFYLATRVNTSVVGTLYSGDIEVDLLKSSKGYAGFLLGARVFDVSSLLAAPDENQRVTQSAVAPVPVIGVVGRYYLGRRVSAEGELAGMTIGSRGTAYDLGLSARLHFSDRMAASVAYRKIKLRGENDRDSGDLRHSGWSFGLEMSL